MRGYQIFIKTEKGWQYYSKTPIYGQALNIKYQLEQKGYKVIIRNLAAVEEF